MLLQIISLVLDALTGLVVAACLLRFYMQFQRVNMSARMGNPLAAFVFSLSNWVVLPLRKFIPPIGRIDTSSLTAAYGLLLLKSLLLSLLLGELSRISHLWIFALFELLHVCVSGLFWLVILYVALSWLNAGSPIYHLMTQLVSPLLWRIRRALPQVGGIDLSPVVLLLALQILQILLSGLLSSILGVG